MQKAGCCSWLSEHKPMDRRITPLLSTRHNASNHFNTKSRSADPWGPKPIPITLFEMSNVKTNLFFFNGLQNTLAKIILVRTRAASMWCHRHKFLAFRFRYIQRVLTEGPKQGAGPYLIMQMTWQGKINAMCSLELLSGDQTKLFHRTDDVNIWGINWPTWSSSASEIYLTEFPPNAQLAQKRHFSLISQELMRPLDALVRQSSWEWYLNLSPEKCGSE